MGQPATITGVPAPGRTCRAASIRSALSPFRHGAGDPTTALTRPGPFGEFRRATWTPDGPGTIRLTWCETTDGNTTLESEAWGPGSTWLLARTERLAGLEDPGSAHLEHDEHPVVARAARNGRHLRIGRSDDLYHELLPTILEQRITSGEAVRQWGRLCRSLGEPAPGPFTDLLLPPHPDDLRRRPTWWFHPLGIERRRASTLVEVARHAGKLWDWSERSPADADRLLRLLPGIGPWTTGSVLGPAIGDPDALCVGDYHAKNVVAWALHGRPRGTDEEMLVSLAPYAGQRGRVLRLLGADGHAAPKFGPRQRILPMARW